MQLAASVTHNSGWVRYMVTDYMHFLNSTETACYVFHRPLALAVVIPAAAL
jgi:hypothetical protein